MNYYIQSFVFVIFFLLCNVHVSGQRRQCFKYKVPSDLISDTLPGLYPGIEKEFKYCRIYINDSTFIESGLFSKSDSTTSNKFKICGNDWYLLVHRKWQLFYRPGIILSPQLEINKLRYRLRFLRFWKIRDEELIEYQLEPAGSFSVGTSPIYVFNSKKGFIQIKVDDFILERKDL